MGNDAGFKIVRFGDVPWEPRTEDEWPCLTKRLLYDEKRDLTCRYVWYARGAVEPRHVHGGGHAAFLMLGQADVDGESLGPWDVVYGPGEVPHGPLVYPVGCMLFVMLNGGALHTAVDGDAGSEELAGVPGGPIIESEQSWRTSGDGRNGSSYERKTMLEDPGRNYYAIFERWAKGSIEPSHIHTGTHAKVVMSGRVKVGDQILGPWDLMYAADGAEHGPIEYLDDVTLAVTISGDLDAEGGEAA